MAQLRSDLTFCMPFSNLMHLPFAEKIRTTQLAGFSELTLHPKEIKDTESAGISIPTMRTMLDDAGLFVNRIDALCTWVPEWKSIDMDEEYHRISSTQPDAFLALAEQFGCNYISLNAMFPAGR
jgi:hypothetical protein